MRKKMDLEKLCSGIGGKFSQFDKEKQVEMLTYSVENVEQEGPHDAPMHLTIDTLQKYINNIEQAIEDRFPLMGYTFNCSMTLNDVSFQAQYDSLVESGREIQKQKENYTGSIIKEKGCDFESDAKIMYFQREVKAKMLTLLDVIGDYLVETFEK